MLESIPLPREYLNTGTGFLELWLVSHICTDRYLRHIWTWQLGQPWRGQAVGLEDCSRFITTEIVYSSLFLVCMFVGRLIWKTKLASIQLCIQKPFPLKHMVLDIYMLLNNSEQNINFTGIWISQFWTCSYSSIVFEAALVLRFEKC